MRVGLVGYSGSGKSTVFKWLTGAEPDPGKVQQGQVGTADVADARLDYFFDLFKPKKPAMYAKITFLDTPGLLPTEREHNPARLSVIRTASGLVVVLDGFSGSDPAQELSRFRDECLFADMEIVNNRIDKLKVQVKKPRPQKEKDIDLAELALLERIFAAMEAGKSPSSLGLAPDDEKLIRSFQLLTLKQELVFLNCSETTLAQPVPPALLALAPNTIKAAPRFELELLDLSEEDRQMFIEEAGFTGSTKSDIIRQMFEGMHQQVFFTVGEDECRAWPIVKGATAVDGAAEIHTDLAKRFVRAEVVGYDDFRKAGSMKSAKTMGLQRLEGKTYVVQDGDVMHIL